MAPANVFAFVTFGALRFEIRGDGRTMGFPRGKMGETGKAGSWLSERQHFGNTHLLPPSQWATRSTQLISVSVRARDQLKCPMGFRTKKSGNQSWSADQV